MYEQFGIAAISNSVETNLLWGGDRNQIGVLQHHGLVYSADIADAVNSPTTAIRAGLLVGMLTSSGELEEWDAEAQDGTQDLYGVVPQEFSTLDEYATAVDKIPPGPIVRAPLVASSLLIQGAAFVGHDDEFLARRNLQIMGCVLDDDPQGFKTGLINRTLSVAGTTLTPTTAQNGMTFLMSAEGSTTVTLPTCLPGLEYTFIRLTSTANPAFTEGELVVTTAGGADVMIGETADAAVSDVDTLTYTTADQHNGSWVKVRGIYDMGITVPVAKWFVTYNAGNTAAFSVT